MRQKILAPAGGSGVWAKVTKQGPNANVGLQPILFYVMTFMPKCHILATRGKTCGILIFFGHILAILEDFLNELEKMNKTEKLRLVHTYLECSHFFIFS